MQLISSVIKGSENRNMAVDLRIDSQFSNQDVIVFVHGFKGFKDWGHFPMVGDELAKAGFAFVSFNFTHDGTTIENPIDFADLEAFGRNNYDKELFDIEQVINRISNATLFPDVDLNRNRIYLLGHSRGGGVSIVKASENPLVKGVVTWGSIGDMGKTAADLETWKGDGVVFVPNARTNEQMPMYYQFVVDYLAQEERYNLQKCCSKIEQPALFIHGTNDATVPSLYAKKLHSWSSNSNLLLIEDGDHTFGGKHPFTESELPADSKKAVEASIKHFRNIS